MGKIQNHNKTMNPSYSEVTWASWYLESLATQLYAQQLVEANIKETPKPLLLALCEGNPPVTGGFPSKRANNTESVFMS